MEYLVNKSIFRVIYIHLVYYLDFNWFIFIWFFLVI